MRDRLLGGSSGVRCAGFTLSGAFNSSLSEEGAALGPASSLGFGSFVVFLKINDAIDRCPLGGAVDLTITV